MIWVYIQEEVIYVFQNSNSIQSFRCLISLDEYPKKKRKPHQFVFPVYPYRQHRSKRPYQCHHELVSEPDIILHVVFAQREYKAEYEILEIETLHIELPILTHYPLDVV